MVSSSERFLLRAELPSHVAVPLGLLIVVVLMRWTFALRGDGHLEQVAKTAKFGRQFVAPTSGDAVQNNRIAWLFNRFLALQTQSSPSPSLARRLLPLALGNSFHWTTFVTLALLMCAGTSIVTLTIYALVHSSPMAFSPVLDTFLVGLFGLFVLALLKQVSAPFSLAPATRTEQTLIGLTELAPV